MEIDPKNACCFTGHRPERLTAPEEKVIEWFNGTDHRYKKPGEMEHILSTKKGFLLQGDNVL